MKPLTSGWLRFFVRQAISGAICIQSQGDSTEKENYGNLCVLGDSAVINIFKSFLDMREEKSNTTREIKNDTNGIYHDTLR